MRNNGLGSQQLGSSFRVSNYSRFEPQRATRIRTERGLRQVFLTSQLAEISQRFQTDVEDLQVLLQEEGLPIQSEECLQLISQRLNSDPRFRQDVAFLVRSILGREGQEPGSMDVLGVLVVAAAGTRQELKGPSAQRSVRQLLRFVIQQKRPVAVSALTPASTGIEAGRITSASRSPLSVSQPESSSPARPAPSVPSGPQKISIAPPIQHAVLSAARAESEPFWPRVHGWWVFGIVALLVVVGGILVMKRGGAGAKTLSEAAPTTGHSTGSRGYSALSNAKPSVVFPPPRQSAHNLRSSSLTRATRGRERPIPFSTPTTPGASTPPKMFERLEPAEHRPELSQPVNLNPPQSVPLNWESASLSLPNVGRQPITPGFTDVRKVFAHPEAAAAVEASDVPVPVFRPRDPVLIARNRPAAADRQPKFQGIVHLGSTGNMASSLMYSPEPEYPAQAIAAGVEGQVMIRAVVGPRGNVVDASVVSGPPLLREAALEAVGRWRYRPYQQDGNPVTIATTAILDFQISPNGREGDPGESIRP
jgi:TonB family protein